MIAPNPPEQAGRVKDLHCDERIATPLWRA